MAPRLPELIKRARRLALDRDRLMQELARDWSRRAQGAGLLAAGPRRALGGLDRGSGAAAAKESTQSAGAETIRREANEVIARVRERVEGELAAGG